MRCIEEEKRIAECGKCDDCVCWHKYCKAECCKMIDLNIDPVKLNLSGEYVRIKSGLLAPSDQWYYRLHGVQYNRGVLSFKKKNITMIGKRIVYFYVCDYLDENNLCKGHPDKKPEICRVLNEETATKSEMRFFITDNCLFKYKMMKGGNNNVKEKDSKES